MVAKRETKLYCKSAWNVQYFLSPESWSYSVSISRHSMDLSVLCFSIGKNGIYRIRKKWEFKHVFYVDNASQDNGRNPTTAFVGQRVPLKSQNLCQFPPGWKVGWSSESSIVNSEIDSRRGHGLFA